MHVTHYHTINTYMYNKTRAISRSAATPKLPKVSETQIALIR